MRLTLACSRLTIVDWMEVLELKNYLSNSALQKISIIGLRLASPATELNQQNLATFVSQFETLKITKSAEFYKIQRQTFHAEVGQ